MASIVKSARKSTASVFDIVGTTADAANKLVTTGVRAIDALDAKTEAMHKRIIRDIQIDELHATDEAVIRAASKRTDLLEQMHRDYRRNEKFDRTAVFNRTVKEITKELAKDKKKKK